jgi:uncharacterized repeat protein (TIGR03803 family)
MNESERAATQHRADRHRGLRRRDCASIALVIGALCSVSATASAQPQPAGPPLATLTKLADFNGVNGRHPRSLILASDGNFYGTTADAIEPTQQGSIFRLTPSGKLTTLVWLDGSSGSRPRNANAVVEGSDGNFYGTITYGGSGCAPNGCGSVFRMTPSGELTTLVSFDVANGAYPNAGLIQGSDGNFYGTTKEGGVHFDGTVFRMTPTGELTNLASFDKVVSGRSPLAELVEGSDGNFYGTTHGGGPADSGSVFQVTPSGTLKSLAFLDDNVSGAFSTGRLVEGSDGDFYGTTLTGGGNGACGTVFKITPSGSLTRLVALGSGIGSGCRPGDLVLGRDGNFYATTETDITGMGTAFVVTPAGTLTTLITFTDNKGRGPGGPLVQGSDGSFYGTALNGGTHRKSTTGWGTVFKLTVRGGG